MPLIIPSEQDRLDARRYWRDREFKTFAVDVTAGPDRRLTFASTYYARATTGDRAIACIRRNLTHLPARARFSARLAGPRELGCVPSGAN